MEIHNIQDLDLEGKRVFIRSDLNVPLDEDGNITDDTRIRSSLETIVYALKENAYVMVTSHLGRPVEGQMPSRLSLKTVGERLSDLLNSQVILVQNWVENRFHLSKNKVFLLENCRANVGEKNNDTTLAKKMAKLCDVFVHDAFGSAHRAEATTFGLPLNVNEKCMGFLMSRELENLKKIYSQPARPVIAIVGGSKVSTKLDLLHSLLKKVDFLIVGGGIANTFLKAMGYEIGKSLVEDSLITSAKKMIDSSKKESCEICLPEDVIVADFMKNFSYSKQVKVNQVSSREVILDVGIDTQKKFEKLINEAGTIIWNGPIGLFEINEFSYGTESIASAISDCKGFTAIGGGDTISAASKFSNLENFDYISTGGGAFLKYLQGNELPAISSLKIN